MSKIIQSVRNLIAQILGQSPDPRDQQALLAEKLIAMLGLTQEHELSCDEVFEVVDKYAEAVVRGIDTRQLMPLVHHHLQLCGECREELEMLLEMMHLETA